MKNWRTYILILIVGVLTLSAEGKSKELSLSDAVSIGLERNYDLQIIYNSEKKAMINNSWGKAGTLPSINFSVAGRENFNLNKKENIRTQSITPEVNLSWVVFNGFSAKITKQKLELLEKQSSGNSTILIESTIQDIVLAYYNCIVQRELLEVYTELNQLSEDRYKRSEDSKEMGASTTYENLQAKTAWLEDQSNYLQQKVKLENAIRTLNFLLAEEDDAKWELTTPLQEISKVYDLSQLKSKLLANNKTLKNQYLNQSLLAKEVELTKSQLLPKLSLNLGARNGNSSMSYSGNTPDVNQHSTDAFFGLTLSYNIFNGGTTKRSIQLAQLSEQTGEIEISQMKHSLTNQLTQQYSNYKVQQAIFELAKKKESVAKLNLELSGDKLKAGAINSFNYRDVQITYMNSALNKLSALYNLIETNIGLMRLTGGIIDEYE